MKEEQEPLTSGDTSNELEHSRHPDSVAVPSPPLPNSSAREAKWPIQTLLVLVLIWGAATIQHRGLHLESWDPALKDLIVFMLIVCTILFGTIGTILGCRGKIAVFSSNFDVLITGLTTIFGLMNLLDWDDKDVGQVVHLGSLSCNAMFLWFSYRANRNILAMLVVVPAKFLCTGILLFMGILTAITGTSAIAAARERQYKKAATLAGTSIAAGASTLWITRFLESLIRKSSSSQTRHHTSS